MNIYLKYLISIVLFALSLIEFISPSNTHGVSYAIAPLMAMGIASSAIKGVTGIMQMMKKRPNEVTYDIPSEVYQSLDLARARATGTNPMFQTQKENLESQTAAMARRATELGGPAAMGSLSKLQANQMAGTRDIDMMEEQYQLQQERAYAMQLENVARYKDREFDLNELQPNERQWNEFYNSKTAGQQNLMGSMDSIAMLAGAGMGNEGTDKALSTTLGLGDGSEEIYGIGDGGGGDVNNLMGDNGDFKFQTEEEDLYKNRWDRPKGI